jgi:hypothetical protein
VVLGAIVLSAAGLGACGDEAATTCTEQSGATFCVQREGGSGLAPSAEGLQPGSTLTYAVAGFGPEAQPFTSTVGPSGKPDKTGVIGVMSATAAFDPAAAEVTFTGTAADGTPVTATVVVGG